MLKHARNNAKKSLTKLTDAIGQLVSPDVDHSAEETGKEKTSKGKNRTENASEAVDLEKRKLYRGEMMRFEGNGEEIVHYEKASSEERIIFEVPSLAGNCRESVSPTRPPRRQKKMKSYKKVQMGKRISQSLRLKRQALKMEMLRVLQNKAND